MWLFFTSWTIKDNFKKYEDKFSNSFVENFLDSFFFFFILISISIFIIGTYGATYKKIHAPKETSLQWQFWSRYFIDLHCFHFHTHVLPFYFFSFTLITKIISSFIKIIYPNIENILYLIIIKYFKQRYTS